MMITVSDYRKEVLGISFRGAKTKAHSNHVDEADLVFFTDSNDYNLQKPMVDKILSLFNKKPLVLTNKPAMSLKAKALFVFGPIQPPNSIKTQDRFSFQSFSDISQDGNLKRELWEKLKKYT